MASGRNAAGEESRYTYNGFGHLVANGMTINRNNYGYTGTQAGIDHVLDYTSPLASAIMGMYDASGRRFMAVDPIKGTVTDPQTMVQYTYCLNNPVRHVDLLGLAVTEWDRKNLTEEELFDLAANTYAWEAAS